MSFPGCIDSSSGLQLRKLVPTIPIKLQYIMIIYSGILILRTVNGIRDTCLLWTLGCESAASQVVRSILVDFGHLNVQALSTKP